MTVAMFETDPSLATESTRPALPQPRRERWQPLRCGLVELFHYDSEEFWFHDGHLLLRGNNGTGKSKVLSLTLPFLFDAQLRSSRIEPDGDHSKKMAWNLLLGSYPRRIGYTWIEFGRRTAEGATRYLTLGAGLSAVAGKAQVDSWFFILEGAGDADGPRIGQDLWLTNAQRVVLTRDKLREAIEGRGQLFDAQNYRRAVDERLFHLGAKRYESLMDTLIQLRHPQLSKKPDESGVSHALTESLPPMPLDLLGDVAEALNQLEEDRKQLDEARKLQQAVDDFEQRYRTYTGILTRRQARELRQAQTGFDKASEERSRAQVALQQARDAEAEAIQAHETVKSALIIAGERLETLQSDPDNREVNRLSQAEKDAGDRRGELAQASENRSAAEHKLSQEKAHSEDRQRHTETLREELAACREKTAKTAAAAALPRFDDNPLLAAPSEELAELALPQLNMAATALRDVSKKRRQDLALLRQRYQLAAQQQTAFESLQRQRQERQSELDESLEQRALADLRVEHTGAELIQSWSDYHADLQQLRFDESESLRRLADWVVHPNEENPALTALARAHQQALRRQADEQSALEHQRDADQRQRTELIAERDRLNAGEDAFPPPPPTRAWGIRSARVGAPLWQLVDFRAQLSADQRAGLEAALEASGLLDAWLSPDGALSDAAGAPWLDGAWTRRSPQPHSLLDVLQPAIPDDSTITTDMVAVLLAGVAHTTHDVSTTESWIAADGRYRLGALAGAWRKPEAVYIGHAARARARQRRLAEITEQLRTLEAHNAVLERHFEQLQAAGRQVAQEWQKAPTDRPLHTAIEAAAGAGRDAERARQRWAQAVAQCDEAEAKWQAAREQWQRDAADLGLPHEPQALAAIEQALEHFDSAQTLLFAVARDWNRAWPELLAQRQRLLDAEEVQRRASMVLTIAHDRAKQAQARFEVLRDSIGQKVETLLQKLAQAKLERERLQQEAERKETLRRETGEQRAVAVTEAAQQDLALAERVERRGQALERLQRFAESDLLAAALPKLALPEKWTIDSGLNLARDAEKLLQPINDSEDAWKRIQSEIAQDLTQLHSALSALGHQAISEPNDWGLSIHIQYQQRVERPHDLAELLSADIAQRRELLSAREREVLENHLQAEIAAEIQRLMRAADQRVNAINTELYKRPTTTGMRYRLKWEPLTTEEGAPAGLDLARERLLNTSADLWSTEDRRVVGAMLQQQIAAERSRADTDVAGRSLIDQLARALDYRYWHRFRILRLQDGQWRKLSGPASSGERALGLTVPLFAAISSFYEHGGNPLAPRLMLLDEAFAGIDDAARAHCMALIREFDLDFVITSEREWACYAELPGVSICQLQRREGIDAVFVSRWHWDGRDKRAEHDPDRRFPPP